MHQTIWKVEVPCTGENNTGKIEMELTPIYKSKMPTAEGKKLENNSYGREGK